MLVVTSRFRGMRRRAAILLASGLALGGIAAWLYLRGEPAFQERLLATAPLNADLDRVAFSGDGTEVAYVVRDNGREAVAVGNLKSLPFDEIELLQYAPNRGTALFYAGRIGQQWTLMSRDKALATADRFLRLQFNEETGEPFYVAQAGAQARLEHRTEKSALVDEIGELVFAPSGGRYAYAAREGGQWRVVEGTQRGDPWDAITGLAYNATGDALAYAGREWAEWYLIAGRSKFGPFDAVKPVGSGPDGRAVRYVARIDRQAKLFEGDKLLDEVEGEITAVRNASAVVGFLHRTEKGSVLKAGTRTFPVSNDADVVTLSPDGRRVAFAVRTDAGARILLDGTPKEFQAENVSELRFTGSGSVVYKARVGPEEFIVADDSAWSLLGIQQRTPLKFSRSGSKVAFGARRNRELWWRVIDVRRKTGAIEAVNPDFEHWQIVGRGKSRAGVEFAQDGRLALRGRPVNGFTAKPDVRHLLLSPRSFDRAHLLLFDGRVPNGELWLVSVNDGRAAPVMLPGRVITVLRHDWSPSGSAAFLRTGPETYWIDVRSGQGSKLDVGLPRNVLFSDIDDVTWEKDDRLNLSVSGWCIRDDGLDKCESKRGRRYQVTTGPDINQIRTYRVDVDTPDGAEETLTAYLGALTKGDLENAFKYVSSTALNPKERDAARRAVRVLAPFLRSLASRTTIAVPRLTVNPSYAQATVTLTGPDFRNTPQGQQFANEFMGWMFMTGLQSLGRPNDPSVEEEQLRSLVPIVQRFAESVADIPAPSRTVSSVCTLFYEGGKWLVSPTCGNFSPM